MNDSPITNRPLLRKNCCCSSHSVSGILRSTHRLSESPLFNDDSLAALIDNHPRSETSIRTMGMDPYRPNQERRGKWSGQNNGKSPTNGKTLLHELKNARLALTLRKIHQCNAGLGRLTDRLIGEFARMRKLSPTSGHQSDLVIESPTAIDYLACDGRPAIHWQIRGSREVISYPVKPPSFDISAIENHVVGDERNPRNLYLEPAMEDDATTCRLTAGQMIALPLFRPYRCVIGSRLSVSLITRHVDRPSRRSIETLVGNRLIDRIRRSSLNIDPNGNLVSGKLHFFASRCLGRMFASKTIRQVLTRSRFENSESSFVWQPAPQRTPVFFPPVANLLIVSPSTANES